MIMTPAMSAYSIVHLLRAVEHVDHKSQCFAQIFRRFRFTGTGGTGRCTAQHEMKGLGEGDVTPVRQGSHHQTRSIAQIFVIL